MQEDTVNGILKVIEQNQMRIINLENLYAVINSKVNRGGSESSDISEDSEYFTPPGSPSTDTSRRRRTASPPPARINKSKTPVLTDEATLTTTTTTSPGKTQTTTYDETPVGQHRARPAERPPAGWEQPEPIHTDYLRNSKRSSGQRGTPPPIPARINKSKTPVLTDEATLTTTTTTSPGKTQTTTYDETPVGQHRARPEERPPAGWKQPEPIHTDYLRSSGPSRAARQATGRGAEAGGRARAGAGGSGRGGGKRKTKRKKTRKKKNKRKFNTNKQKR